MKKGGRGSSPATLCVRAFSRESLDPPPGTGREPTSQVPTCASPNPDHLPGAARCCVPSGWVPPKPPWGAAPRCPPGPGRGPSPATLCVRAFFGRKPEERTPGLRPGPGFLWPLVPTRWFLWWLFLIRQRGNFLRYTKTDLGRIFEKNMLESIFVKERFQIRG